MTQRPLLIGRDPARPPEKGYVPLTGGSTGRRLAQLCGLDDPVQLVDHFELVNIFNQPVTPKFFSRNAWERAAKLERLFTVDRRVVVFGRDVQAAFNWNGPHCRLLRRISPQDRSYLMSSCPHPSGRSRYWNEPANVERAETFFRGLMEELMLDE